MKKMYLLTLTQQENDETPPYTGLYTSRDRAKKAAEAVLKRYSKGDYEDEYEPFKWETVSRTEIQGSGYPLYAVIALAKPDKKSIRHFDW